MTRRMIAGPDFSGAPLTDLKQWLAIGTVQDDALLQRLLAAAHHHCEQFTGLVALASTFEEQLGIRLGGTGLATRPVTAITAVELLAIDGSRALLDADAYEICLDGDGAALVRLADSTLDKRLVVRCDAGLATDWAALAPGLAEGILRLAAHLYRQRDGDTAPTPPSAVAALWRPYRRLSL